MIEIDLQCRDDLIHGTRSIDRSKRREESGTQRWLVEMEEAQVSSDLEAMLRAPDPDPIAPVGFPDGQYLYPCGQAGVGAGGGILGRSL